MRHIFGKTFTQGLWMPAAVLFLGSLSIGLLIWTGQINEKQRMDYVVNGALMDVQIHTSTFHLWLEEFIGGNPDVDRKNIWKEFETAMTLTDTVLNGGKTEHGMFVKPLKNPESRAQAEGIKASLVEMKEVALERLKEPEKSGIISDLNQRFDKVFGVVLTKTSDLEKIIEAERLRNQKNARHLFFGILSVWTLIVIVAVLGLWIRELRRKKSEKELLSANEVLQTQTEEVERRTVELQALNKHLNLEISERKQAEDVLSICEARYRALYRDNPTMIVTLDAGLTVLSANPFCASQAGYTIDELEGQSVLKLFHEDDRSAVSEQLRRCLQNPNQVFRWQFRKVRKDGSLFWVEEIAQAVHDLNGALNVLVVCQDITERKQLEAEIQDAREYAENIVETVREPLVVLNSDLKILTANHSFYDTFKVTPEETIGNFIYDLGNRQWDIPKLRVLVEEILPLDTVINGYEVEHDFPDIGRKIILLNARQIYREDIGSHIILLAMEDITERKLAEEERELLLVQLDAVLNSINEGVVIFDLEGYILTMNPSALAIHEYESVEQVRRLRQLHQYQETFELSDLDGRPVPFEQWPTVRAFRGERFTDYEVRVRRKDTGKLFVGSFSGTPVQTKSGDVILTVVAVHDITERKRAEEEIERLNTGLAARAVELEAVNQELEAFNYTVAHDLRKPLTVVNGYCQALREMCSDKLDEACKGYLQEAYDGTWRMNQLIDALLNFSRLAHVEMRRETVDLSAMAHEVAVELKLAEPERRVTFLIADGVSADGDVALLRVVLDNLLGNAWKYNGTRNEGIIEFGTTEVDGRPAYFVRDNGAGFDMADADKLFVPFRRLPSAEECRGFGIGLATVERITRRHGGRVWAVGAPGKGASFYFALSAD